MCVIFDALLLALHSTEGRCSQLEGLELLSVMWVSKGR